MQKFIGQKGTIYSGGLRVEVEVLDVKVSYSKTRYLVTPTAGEGRVWVESISLYESN